ncbi:MAG: hypothetical protein HWE26_10920 [Alteromonadaceae bacterium]|nr:hypothetical protein [Alteromonadaceae bacterium]
MKNPFESRSWTPGGPTTDIVPVTPSDSTELTNIAVALYIEDAGTVCIVTATGETRTVAVTGYSILPVGVRQVMATGTTASGLHAFTVS